MIRETREVYIFQKFVCQRFLQSDRRLTHARGVGRRREKKKKKLPDSDAALWGDYCRPYKSSVKVRAKPTTFFIAFYAIMTSSWRSRGSDVTRPCGGRLSMRDERRGFLAGMRSQPEGELVIARQSDLSCRLISCLAFSSSRLLECVRCLLERTYVIWAYFT